MVRNGIGQVRQKNEPVGVSRRGLLAAGGAALAAGLAPAIRRSRAQGKTLRILQWKHFVPAYDEWFNGTYVREWGERHDVEVIVDNVGLGEVHAHAQAEVEAGQGHDLVVFLEPPTAFAEHTIDHHDIYEECERRYGPAPDFAIRATYSPSAARHFAVCGGYLPQLTTYRGDLWDQVQVTPDSWADVLEGGRRVRLLHDKPVGISLASEHNAEHTVRAIMYSFGSAEQDEGGRPALKSPATLEVINYVKSLYQDAMTEEVLAWDAPANNRFMLNGEGSLTCDTMSIARASESLGLEIAPHLRVAPAPAGPVTRLAPSFGVLTYIIWNFAENIELAQQFLVDYLGSSRDALLASGFQNMPSFAGAVPDLAQLVANDPVATPADKYRVLAEGPSWTTNVGHPGHTTGAIGEVYRQGVLTRMLAAAATGRLTPEDALDEADRELRRIFQDWEASGKV
jgi:multiple sugar transport system substrate-binding protein